MDNAGIGESGAEGSDGQTSTRRQVALSVLKNEETVAQSYRAETNYFEKWEA